MIPSGGDISGVNLSARGYGQQRKRQASRDLFPTLPARSVAASITSVPSTSTNQESPGNTLRRSPGKENLKRQRREKHIEAKKPSPQTFIYLNEKPQTDIEEMWFHPKNWSCWSDYGSEYFAA